MHDQHHFPGSFVACLFRAAKHIAAIVLNYPATWIDCETNVVFVSILRVVTLAAQQINTVEISFIRLNWIYIHGHSMHSLHQSTFCWLLNIRRKFEIIFIWKLALLWKLASHTNCRLWFVDVSRETAITKHFLREKKNERYQKLIEMPQTIQHRLFCLKSDSSVACWD